MVGGGEGEGVIGEGDASPIWWAISPVEIYLLDGLKRHGGRVDGEDGGVPRQGLPAGACVAVGGSGGVLAGHDVGGGRGREALQDVVGRGGALPVHVVGDGDSFVDADGVEPWRHAAVGGPDDQGHGVGEVAVDEAFAGVAGESRHVRVRGVHGRCESGAAVVKFPDLQMLERIWEAGLDGEVLVREIQA